MNSIWSYCAGGGSVAVLTRLARATYRCRYTIVLCTFHFSDHLAMALTNPRAVSDDSFMLNHSVAYSVAAVTSWIEFWIERFFFPGEWRA